MTGTVLSDVPPMSPGGGLKPPFLQQIHTARKVISPLQRQTQGLCFLSWESHIFTREHAR